MLKGVDFPIKINGSELDSYLAKGWYRLGQIIFTTDHILHPEGWYRVFWLRFRLESFTFQQKQTKLLQANSCFDVKVKPLALTEELDLLYQFYLGQLDFETSPTLNINLNNYSINEDPQHTVFDSQLIEVRDQGQLIAAGVFDSGENSIAGILNFFDPAYKKYSLGKLLMLLKIRHAIDKGMKFYYPGYIAADWPKFDYKLFPGKTAAEIYDPLGKEWLPYSDALMQELKDNMPVPESGIS